MPIRIESAATAAAIAEPGPTPPRPPAPRPLAPLAGTAAQRAATHQRNLSARRQDLRDYARYADAFVREHGRCRTIEEADAFGGIAEPPRGAEPGAGDAERADWAGRWAGGLDDDADRLWKAAAGRIAAHRFRLKGVKVPLSVEWSASASVGWTDGKARAGAAVSVASGGAPTAEASAGAGPERHVLSASPGGGAPARAREWALGPATLARRDGQPDRLELDAMPGSPLGLAVATDRRSVTLCARAGARIGRDGRGATAEAKACVTLNLLSPEAAEAAVSRR